MISEMTGTERFDGIREALRRIDWCECGWTVIRNGEEGPCRNAPTSVIRYEWDEDYYYAVTCTTHAYRCGAAGEKIPLAEVLKVAKKVWVEEWEKGKKHGLRQSLGRPRTA